MGERVWTLDMEIVTFEENGETQFDYDHWLLCDGERVAMISWDAENGGIADTIVDALNAASACYYVWFDKTRRPCSEFSSRPTCPTCTARASLRETAPA